MQAMRSSSAGTSPLDLGLRYEYKGVPAGDKLQRLNAISSVPGVLTFGEPRAQKWNFALRARLGVCARRRGQDRVPRAASASYDSYFTNLGTLTKPPQLENTFRVDPAAQHSRFLGQRRHSGPRPQRPAEFDEATARRTTSTYIQHQHLPYSIQWTLGIERVIARDYSLNVRYLGTRGVRLFTQSLLPVVARANPGRSLPTYLQRPVASGDRCVAAHARRHRKQPGHAGRVSPMPASARSSTAFPIAATRSITAWPRRSRSVFPKGCSSSAPIPGAGTSTTAPRISSRP